MSHETVRRYDDDEPRKETSIVDQLFLELSQFTQAVTAQESRLLDERNILLGELGKAKTERDALLAQAWELADELQNIANANTRDWDDPTDFKAWAQSRARHALQKAQAVLDATKKGM